MPWLFCKVDGAENLARIFKNNSTLVGTLNGISHQLSNTPQAMAVYPPIHRAGKIQLFYHRPGYRQFT